MYFSNKLRMKVKFPANGKKFKRYKKICVKSKSRKKIYITCSKEFLDETILRYQNFLTVNKYLFKESEIFVHLI